MRPSPEPGFRLRDSLPRRASPVGIRVRSRFNQFGSVPEYNLRPEFQSQVPQSIVPFKRLWNDCAAFEPPSRLCQRLVLLLPKDLATEHRQLHSSLHKIRYFARRSQSLLVERQACRESVGNARPTSPQTRTLQLGPRLVRVLCAIRIEVFRGETRSVAARSTRPARARRRARTGTPGDPGDECRGQTRTQRCAIRTTPTTRRTTLWPACRDAFSCLEGLGGERAIESGSLIGSVGASCQK